MTWGRLHDGAGGSPKLLALSDGAWRLWGNGLIYVQRELSDGFIPEAVIRTFGIRARNVRAAIDELCRPLVPGKAPLWHRAGPGAPELNCRCLAGTPGAAAPQRGFQIHDYLEWNDSRAQVLEARARAERDRGATRDRMRRFRDRVREARGDGSDGARDASLLERDAARDGERAASRDASRDGPPHTPPVRTTSTEDPKIPAARTASTRAKAKWTVYLRRAHEAWEAEAQAGGSDAGDVIERFKTACARAQLFHDGELARKAVEAAEAVRARRGA